jgi:hypothetical protein
MLSALRREPDIDWQRVTAFHMDEYIELPEAPNSATCWPCAPSGVKRITSALGWRTLSLCLLPRSSVLAAE